MIRSELITRIAAQNPHLYQREIEGMVAAILDRIAEALAAGDRVELRDFGVFEVKLQRARPGRNPRTGAAVEVVEKAVVRFKPGRGMQARLNPKPEAVAEAPPMRRAS